MLSTRFQALLAFTVLLYLTSPLHAQDNFSASFDPPDFLNVCGDPDQETVTIRLKGSSPETRSNILATANLFKGVTFDQLNLAASTPGVMVDDISDLTRPTFSLPDMSPATLTRVNIVFSVQAGCEYTDTVRQNNELEVFDTWEISYDLGAQVELSEEEGSFNNGYRGAFQVPFVAINVPSDIGPQKLGDCLSRTITASNSGLNGFIDTLVYINQQGAGIHVQSVTVNGTAFPVSKTVNLSGDTIITAAIAGSYFTGNTVGNGPGDGDNFLDPNETVTIVENFCVVNCSASRQSIHQAAWGCEGDLCEVAQMSSFVRLGDGNPNLQFVNTGSLTNVNVGYCQVGQTSYTISNNGVDIDPGFGTMIDLSLGIFFGDSFLVLNNYEITSLTIAGINLPDPNAINQLHGHALFTSDPDGPGGLTDQDGDGFFDDLPVGESLEMNANFEFSCSNAQQTEDRCTNDFSATLKAKVAYSNACRQLSQGTNISIQSPSNKNSSFENCSTPDDYPGTGSTFFVTHMEERSIRFFEKNCSGGEQYVVRVVLPQGVTPDLGLTTFTVNNSFSSLPVISSQISNDTLTIVYDGSTNAIINGNYELDMAFTADCTADPGQSFFYTEIEFVCPPCNCRHLWYCDNIVGPQFHLNDPPCTGAALSCPTGLQTTSFETNRITFGFTDNTYSTPIDPAVANTKVAISCDSVEMKVLNVVGGANLTDSIGVIINHINVDGSSDTLETFNFARARVRINNGGTDFYCDLDPAAMTITQQDSLKTLRFDLHNCLTALGLTLLPGDTIEFLGYFTINPDGPYSSKFRKVPGLRGYAYAVVDGVEYVCDNFGDVFTIAKNTTGFDFPRLTGFSNTFPKGCAETFMDYRLLPGINGYRQEFGNEFRKVVEVDSISFNFDTAVLAGFTVFEPMVSFPGHPVFGNNFIPLPGFENFPDGRYVVRFDTMAYKPSFNDASPYAFLFRIRAIPDCKTSGASSNNNNRYDFDPKVYFRDNFFASELGDGSCSEFKELSVDNDIIYTNAPTFSFFPISDSNYDLFADTAIWILQHCNNSFFANAGVSWIALESLDSAVTIVSIEDISDPGNPADLTLSRYGLTNNNAFAFAPALLRSNGINTQSQICNTIRVKAIMNRCGMATVTARAGWNCTPYSEPDWNPEDYPPCNDLSTALSVTSQDPFIDAAETDIPAVHPELCDTAWVTILVKNTDLGTLYDMRSQLVIPLEGASFAMGSVAVAYPSGAAFQPAAGDPVFRGSSPRGQVFQYDDFSGLLAFLDQGGLPGFNPQNPTDSNELKIRFGFITDCDYQSGALAFYNFQGVKGCGDPSNLEAGESRPMIISGAEPGSDKLYRIAITNNPVLLADGKTTFEVTITNLSSTVSDMNDRVVLKIPAGIDYVANSGNAITPGNWTVTEPSEELISGMKKLSWSLPNGLEQNQQAIYTFQLQAPILSCSDSSVETALSTVNSNSVLCSGSGFNCEIETINSENGEQSIELIIGRSQLSINSHRFTSICLNQNEEELSNIGTIDNAGDDFPDRTFQVKYHFDADGNGAYSPGDPQLASFIESGPIDANSSIPISHVFAASHDALCGIVVRIDTTGLGICNSPEIFLAQAQLQNAGQDEVICATSPVSITRNLGDVNCQDTGSYNYEWKAIAPASVSDLSSTDIPDPVLNVNHGGSIQDTLQYILETTRSGCSMITADTVVIIRAVGVSIGQQETVFLERGKSTPLALELSGGEEPLSYVWSPADDLDDAFSASPVASPMEDTDYSVTVTNASGCSATGNLELRMFDPCNLALLNSISIIEPNCGLADGSVRINLSQDESNFSYQWFPDTGTVVGNGNFREDLPFGNYRVLISDTVVSGCVLEVNLIVENKNAPTASVDSVSAATCTASDGFARLVPSTFNYNWSDGGSGYQRDDLAAGVYFVTLSDPADSTCENILQVDIEGFNPLEATVEVNNYPTCGEMNGTVTITVTGGSGNYTFGGGRGGNVITGLAAGPHTINIVENNGSGCFLPFTFHLTNEEAATLELVRDTFHLACPGDENGRAEFTVEYDEGFPFPADTIIHDMDDRRVENGNLSPGDYCISIRDANNCVAAGDCFTIVEPDTLHVILLITPDCNRNGSIQVTAKGGTGPYTFDWADLEGSVNHRDRTGLTAGTYDLTVADSLGCVVREQAVHVPVCPETCEYFDGRDSVAINACETQLLCVDINLQDTSRFEFWVDGQEYSGGFGTCFIELGAYSYNELFGQGELGPYQLSSWMVNDTVFSGEFQDMPDLVDSMNVWDPNGNWILLDDQLIIFGGNPDNAYSAMHIVKEVVNVSSTLAFNSQFVPEGLALTLEKGEHWVTVVSKISGCTDSIFVTLDCAPLPDHTDTVFITETGQYCIDTLRLQIEGEIATVDNICAEAGNHSVNFSIDTSALCISYEGIRYGMDTSCIQICDDLGNCDTINLAVAVISLPPENIVDTIFINETVNVCVDTSNFANAVTRIENLCLDEYQGNVEFLIDEGQLCLEYMGLQLGRDSACVIACDDLGFCDTTFYSILVIEYPNPPIAVDDFDTTAIGSPVVVDIKANDITLGGIDTAYLLSEPAYGTATLNLDCTVTYNASDEFCEREDQFTYVICNPVGCDTADVFIFIECIDIVIFNGISPNLDGVNDVFYVAGIEDKPDNELFIYNRWGTLVFRTKNYKNDWQGTWRDNRDLPDGTYFYVLRLNEPDDKRVFRGYIEIHR